MRYTISKMVAAFAVLAASAAPAMACGGLFASGGCSPCGGPAYASPCSESYGYERLPDPTPVTRQYYYANQGPTFSGPGMFAPAPTYQESAIGWRGYPRYDGGPYASPIDHYSYAPAYRAPVVYSYQPRMRYAVRPNYRYGYRHGYRHTGPRVMYAPRHGYHHQRPLRRAY